MILSNVVKNDVVKKTEYNKLVTNVDHIDTTGYILKSAYDTDKSYLGKKITDAEKKIPNTNDLAKKTDLNTEITEIENKIPSITGLAANSALSAVESKIPDASSLVKKTITQKYQILKRKLLIIIMKNILLLRNSID